VSEQEVDWKQVAILAKDVAKECWLLGRLVKLGIGCLVRTRIARFKAQTIPGHADAVSMEAVMLSENRKQHTVAEGQVVMAGEVWPDEHSLDYEWRAIGGPWHEGQTFYAVRVKR
jgi:hypothetical protein